MPDMTSDIILVDDDSQLRAAIAQAFDLDGLPVQQFGKAEQALSEIDPRLGGIVITDVRMPGMNGIQLFEEIRKIDVDIPVILITGHGEIPMAVNALKNGAYDFIEKPFAPERLVESARRALDRRKLVLENRALRQKAEASADNLPLLGQTPAMLRLRDTIRHIANTDVDVLIAGETGSGKEVVATALHHWSNKRKTGNFVALNCGALPEAVIESELFGHEAGAFTGAQKKRIGRIEHAAGGTLFLDEIESMPLALQVKMLRVLEMREVSPLGSNDVRSVDLRVIAASKLDLSEASKRGEFRDDLYYRLNVVTLSIPPLRERREDIPLLFSHFLRRALVRFNMEMPTINAEISRYMQQHHWPGNVRELAHFADRVALGVHEVAISEDVSPLPQDGSGSLSQEMERQEERLIRGALHANSGDVTLTIAALGIARKTFYDKLQRHNINRQDYAKK
jgi:two-component system C4-dicarboxylate transport response regulator DctD